MYCIEKGFFLGNKEKYRDGVLIFVRGNEDIAMEYLLYMCYFVFSLGFLFDREGNGDVRRRGLMEVRWFLWCLVSFFLIVFVKVILNDVFIFLDFMMFIVIRVVCNEVIEVLVLFILLDKVMEDIDR